jgi:hypothetical protein
LIPLVECITADEDIGTIEGRLYIVADDEEPEDEYFLLQDPETGEMFEAPRRDFNEV